MKKTQPIRVGDKFKVGPYTWEVYRILPFGQVELAERAQLMFDRRTHAEVRTWERVA